MICIDEVASCYVCVKAKTPTQAVMAFTILDGGEENSPHLFSEQNKKTVYICNNHLQEVVENWYELYHKVPA